MRCLRYLPSSSVCSGARVPDFPPVLADTRAPDALLRGDYRDPATWATGIAFRLTIIAIERRDTQLRIGHAHLQPVETVLGERNILGIIRQQVLRAEVLDQIGKRFVELGPERRRKDATSSARGQCRERVFAADIAPGIVGDGDYQDGIDDAVRQLRGLERLVKIHGAGGIAAIRDDHHDAPAIAVFEIFCREINSVVERSARFGLERVHRVFDGYGVAREMIVLDYLVIEA